MKTIAILIFSICCAFVADVQDRIEINDFSILDNTHWEGTLMYKNYSDGRKVEIPTEVNIRIQKNKIVMDVRYPEEPKANSKKAIKIKKQGSYFGSEKVLKKERLEDGSISFTTFFEGRDNNKKATMYKTYIFSETKFSVVKEVQYVGTQEKFIRNKQTLKRIKK